MNKSSAVLPRNLQEARNFEQQGKEIPLHMFWGHCPEPDGSIGAGCLSQWWEAPFEENGIIFRTCEHYMMYRKAILFHDIDTSQRILNARTPREAKMLGRKVRGFKDPVWESERFQVVVQGNAQKFSQHAALRAYLMGTRGRLLVEASPYDRVWGIGMSRNDVRAQSPGKWLGSNLLGFALSHVRDSVLTEER